MRQDRRGPNPLRLAAAWAAGVIGVLAAPAFAEADERYASPNGSGSTCTSASPCNIQTAVEDPAVMDGDEVILKPGTYAVGGNPVTIADDILVHGQPGSPRPRIEGTGNGTVTMFDEDARLEDVEIVGSGPTVLLLTFFGLVDRVRSVATANGGSACAAQASATAALIRSSACIASAGGTGLGVSLGPPGDHAQPALQNVTAIGLGAGAIGISLICTSLGDSCTIEARNVIASGTLFDASASGGAVGSATLNLTNSNYDVVMELIGGSITPPGTAGGQTAAPQLVNPAGGDVHQLLGSPTIDAGAAGGQLGTLDLDRNARTIDGAPDIGADELAVCRGKRATIVGTAAADTITGTAARDVVVGLAGNDRITTGAGNDLVCAGKGADRIFTRNGRDRAYGEAGADRIFGGGQRDFLFGQAGFDRIFGNAGGDRLFGGARADRLFGGRGHDRALGQAGNDLLVGNAGADRLLGGGGRDALRGLAGRRVPGHAGPARDRRRAPGCEIRRSIP